MIDSSAFRGYIEEEEKENKINAGNMDMNMFMDPTER